MYNGIGDNMNSLFDCKNAVNNLLGKDMVNILKDAFLAIKIVVPILIVVLIMKDMIVAVTSGDEKNMKKAQKTAVTRIIIGILVFLVPVVVNALLSLIISSGGGYIDPTLKHIVYCSIF